MRLISFLLEVFPLCLIIEANTLEMFKIGINESKKVMKDFICRYTSSGSFKSHMRSHFILKEVYTKETIELMWRQYRVILDLLIPQ